MSRQGLWVEQRRNARIFSGLNSYAESFRRAKCVPRSATNDDVIFVGDDASHERGAYVRF